MYPKLVTFGNVLLDFTYNIERNPGILSKYGILDPNGLGEFSSETLSAVANDANQTCDFLSSQTGGSALNTSKSLLLLGESEIVFCGAIGNDSNGALVRRNLEEIHLKTCLQVIKDHPTGTCVCLINKENRCCYANIGASIHIDREYLQCQRLYEQQSNPEAKSQIYYIEGFFITGHRFSVCKYIVDEVCRTSNGLRRFATNLSAGYLITKHPQEMKFLAENASILFGNYDEFSKLAEIFRLSSTEAVITHLIETKPKEIEDKIIICTQGAEKILYSSSSQMFINKEFHFESVPKDRIIDTTGCGDAFVAGFFYAFLKNESTPNCVAKGVDVAQRKLTSIGGTLSDSK
ncbi:adenosine kinase [Contarinia nasturtii]|uniref:adenosine kinase n=1 Tax=Contarinia nasturtii TaxID=265458 RepID=UPI0012D47920|nr:adenosine kinase [Contarinia nasturtii]